MEGSPNHEEPQPNTAYDKWAEAMKDVQFQGEKEASQTGVIRRILDGLLKRREFFAKLYSGEKRETEEREPRKSVSEVVRELNSREMERTGEILMRPKAEIVCDHDHIEGQRIDVISKKDKGVTEFRLKLRQTEAELATMALQPNGEGEATTPSGAILKRGKFTYEGAFSDETYELCDASIFEKDGVTVFIADPGSRSEGKAISRTENASGLVRTAMGLVKMEAPSDMEPEEVERVISEILEKDFGIKEGLSEVPEAADQDYKMARFKWQHKIVGELTARQAEQAKRLKRKEVFPGYTTMVEEGKHKEYLGAYGKDLRAVHELWADDASVIYSVLKQGLMSSTERYSRGLIQKGKSSPVDLDTGGGDCVFTRIMNAKQRQDKFGTLVVLKPEVFDRTDWYAYEKDAYGTTDDEKFASRLTPDATFANVADPKTRFASNEQMFRVGIGADMIEAIEIDPRFHGETIKELKAMGLTEINGRPIEEIVVARQAKEDK